MLAFYLSLVDTAEEKSKVEKLYNEYRAFMKYTAYSILGNEMLAEDAVHDTFIKIIRNLSSIDDVFSTKTKAYVYVAVHNTAINMQRKEQSHSHADVDVDQLAVSHTEIQGALEAAEVRQKINQLSETHRIIIELKVLHGLSNEQIARFLGISNAAARKRVERARDTFAKILNKKGDDVVILRRK